MCMEDVRIGREGMGRCQSVLVGTAAMEIIPFNQNRIGLVISADGAGTVFLYFGEVNPGAYGIALVPTDPVIMLSVAEYGGLIRMPIFAVASAGTVQVTYGENTLERQ